MSRLSTKIRIYFAKNGTKAVILRQGPDTWTRMLSWETKRDVLIPGQWIRSKITHSHINSDASLILCFVQSYRKRHDYGTWVALSKPPYFTALAYWPIGDSWGGTCFFLTDRKIFIDIGVKGIELKGKLAKGMEWTHNREETNNISFGWQNIKGSKEWSKSSTASGMTVSMMKHDARVHSFTVTVRDSMGNILHNLEDVYFGDFDAYGRFVFTRRNGVIYRITLKKKMSCIEEVFDLSKMEPESIEAPKKAIVW